MSPRPRETSDEEILAATGRAMQNYSPTQLTLAHVAKEAGVVPATLIQRFGTKRNLLLAACRTAPAGVRRQFDAGLGRLPRRLARFLAPPRPRSFASALPAIRQDVAAQMKCRQRKALFAACQ